MANTTQQKTKRIMVKSEWKIRICEQIFKLGNNKLETELQDISDKQLSYCDSNYFKYKNITYPYRDIRAVTNLHISLHSEMDEYLENKRIFEISQAYIKSYINGVLNASNNPNDWAATVPAQVSTIINGLMSAPDLTGQCMIEVNERFEECLEHLQTYLFMSMLEN